ncbi:MAG: hypothetical protein R3D45_07755 [Rhizobiaceae bacterium]
MRLVSPPMKNGLGKIVAGLLCALPLSACTSISSNYSGEITRTNTTRIIVCHGFDCSYKTPYHVSQQDWDRFAEIMAAGAHSPEAERAAVAAADMFYEERAVLAIGVRDEAKSDITQSRMRGQMDCIDESTNTRSLLLFLAKNDWLRYHKVEFNVSRGVFLDARYPHSTAVLKEIGTGRKWAVDSWYEATGGKPDIMPLENWKTRGVMGQR